MKARHVDPSIGSCGTELHLSKLLIFSNTSGFCFIISIASPLYRLFNTEFPKQEVFYIKFSFKNGVSFKMTVISMEACFKLTKSKFCFKITVILKMAGLVQFKITFHFQNGAILRYYGFLSYYFIVLIYFNIFFFKWRFCLKLNVFSKWRLSLKWRFLQ